MPYRSPSQRAVTPQGQGRFPNFDVLDQVSAWDHVTAGAILARLALPGELAFFTPPEVGIAGAVLDLLLGQDADPRVPVLAMIDERLATGETDGWHYDEMPEDADAWRQSLAWLDEDAKAAHSGRGYAGLVRTEQAELLQAVQDRSENGEKWHDWQAKHVWSLWTRYATTAFYSHPWAWNEMGYPGPAYPRGYLNAGVNSREKWEVHDHADVDPVPFADRVEGARKQHAQLVNRGEAT